VGHFREMSIIVRCAAKPVRVVCVVEKLNYVAGKWSCRQMRFNSVQRG
jgi:hypothetical protein